MLVLVGGVAGARDARPELVIPADGVRSGSVAGVPARIRVDPSALGVPMLNPDLAARAGLKGGMIGLTYAVGPVEVKGRTAVTRIDLGRGPVKRRAGWAERAFAVGADGAVGPGGLPDPVIRFQLRASIAGERTVALPMANGGGVFGGWGGTFATIDVGGGPIRVRFDPRRPTFATAGAGVAIAQGGGGMLEGAATRAEIRFGVERPVRAMRLARPLMIGPLAVDRLLVRVSDFGTASSIADADAAAADPDEVVVTAKGKRDRSNDMLTLGHDQLDRCSSITFDKPAKRIRLTCA
jgi:hypothetical protein